MAQPMSLMDKLREAGPAILAKRAGRSDGTVRVWLRSLRRGEALSEQQQFELIRATRDLPFPVTAKDFERARRVKRSAATSN